jgi:ABC-type nitrate/sulfonate/bicarbonate transport system permease component
LTEDIASMQLWRDVVNSLRRICIGYCGGAIVGIFFGVLTGTKKWANLIFGTVFQLLRPIPPIALVPLVIVWFGVGEIGKVLLVGVGVAFPVWLNTHLGVSAISNAHLFLVRSLRPGYWNQLWNIWLPGAAGQIAAGLRTSVALAFYCLIAAEMTGALYGLAYRIELAHTAFRVDRMLGHMFVLGLLSFAADAGARRLLIEVLPWTATTK